MIPELVPEADDWLFPNRLPFVPDVSVQGKACKHSSVNYDDDDDDDNNCYDDYDDDHDDGDGNDEDNGYEDDTGIN